MNARSQSFHYAVEMGQAEEVCLAMFHTLLLHRTQGKIHFRQGSTRSIGALGFQDVDCDLIDFTYVRCASPMLCDRVSGSVRCFVDDMQRSGAKCGQISLEFYKKNKSSFWNPDSIPWEVWTVRLTVSSFTTENDRQLCREELSELLADGVLNVAESISRSDLYVPTYSTADDLELFFETGFPDVQPFLFRIMHRTDETGKPSMSSAMFVSPRLKLRHQPGKGDPFAELRITDDSFLGEISSRSECDECLKSRRYFCYSCRTALPCIRGRVPKVNLPLDVHIVKHPGEIDGKSTAIHAAVIAPENVRIFTYPDFPDYEDDGSVVVVFPRKPGDIMEEESVPVGDLLCLDPPENDDIVETHENPGEINADVNGISQAENEEPSGSLNPSCDQTLKPSRSRSLGDQHCREALSVENELLRTEIDGWRLKFADLESKTQAQFSLLENDLMARIAGLETEKRKNLESSHALQKQFAARRKILQSKIRNNISVLRGKLDGVAERIGKIPVESAETKNLLDAVAKKFAAEFESFQTEVAAREAELEAKNSALLSEMSGMNTVIKQRGERLTQLEAKEEELQAEISRLRADRSTRVDCSVSVQTTETRHGMTEPEERTETGSTATSEISEKDQAARMREVDASLEEYTQKLKLMAIRQKKKIVELEAERRTLVAEAEKTKSTQAMKFQAEMDKLQDALDSKTDELKSIRKDFENAANRISTDSKALAEALELKDKLSAELNSLVKIEGQLTKEKKELEAKLLVADQTASERGKALDLKTSELDSALRKLSDSEIKAFKLEETVKAIEKDGDQAKIMRSQVEDLEKTVSDLTRKLDESKDAAVVMESALKKAGMELKTATSNLTKEKEKCNNFQDTVAKLKAELRESLRLEGELRNSKSQLTAELEELMRMNESLKREMNSVHLDAEEVKEMARQRESELESELAVLKDSSETWKLELETARKSLHTLTTEYESYKTRAKSVLRQHKQLKEDLQRRDAAEESSQAQERERIQTEFLEKMESLSREKRLSEAVLNQLSVEKADLALLLTTKDAELMALSETKADLQSRLCIAEDAVRSLDASLQEERLSKKLMLDAMTVPPTESQSPVTEQMLQQQQPPPLVIDMSTVEREEGEGSESVTTPFTDPNTPIYKFIHGGVSSLSATSPTKLMPLDQLLNSNEAEYDKFSGRRRRESNPTGDTMKRFEEQEELVRELKVSNAELRKKANHLTSLLNDSEETNAKLAEMTEVLKEEIRKEQRNHERQKHLEQTEYIKNVFFKFLTLKAGNERERLIPVLTTLLKLSPAEKNCLVSVAKGIDLEAVQQAGWGSYLGLWKQ
ncbi:unnamed protein product [Notodromas monacha]|uniref:Autophagy-related protein 101 n=1 Tax=Notodromas monacha TaxID=399045 RepID=A0A7R9BV76_9CRUS|nr:unnamed protein product [Notodromas monacha]CAG0921235.1 unnamed protein product [Notodromas monacha]